MRVNCINPERTGTPMRTKAFGEEPPESLLESMTVARASLDTLLSQRHRPRHRPAPVRPAAGNLPMPTSPTSPRTSRLASVLDEDGST